MSAPTIRAVPQTYAGVRFRSTLEADWAATLDSLRIVWQYEPEAVRLPSGELYRPDFYLPEITTWLEVKGPHDDRIGKVRELAEAGEHHPDCPGWLGDRLRLFACTPEQERGIAAAVAAAPDGDTVLTVKSFRVPSEGQAGVPYPDQGPFADEMLMVPSSSRTYRFRRPIAVDRGGRWTRSTGWTCPASRLSACTATAGRSPGGLS